MLKTSRGLKKIGYAINGADDWSAGVAGYEVVPGLFAVRRSNAGGPWAWSVDHLPSGYRMDKKGYLPTRAAAVIMVEELMRTKYPWSRIKNDKGVPLAFGRKARVALYLAHDRAMKRLNP